MTASCTTQDLEGLKRLLEKVYQERGFDFRGYRQTTLTRRLGRRLRAQGAGTYADYARVLDCNAGEYDRLFDDLTINVTSFFRDDVAFRALEEVALPALTQLPILSSHLLRIWSAGCATGQEPCSIAMLLLAMLGQEIGSWDTTILGTDVDEKALGRAQDGWFSPKDVEGVRPAWLDKYFVHAGGGYRIQPALRRLVAFQAHNLVSDPPYHDLDLVVCRNVLIYFTPTVQAQVLESFHQGLKEGGFLLLGRAEVPLAETRALFHCVDSKAKLYRKVGQGNG